MVISNTFLSHTQNPLAIEQADQGKAVAGRKDSTHEACDDSSWYIHSERWVVTDDETLRC